MRRWIRLAALLYPADWRARYGGELDALFDDASLKWSDLADVLRGAAAMQTTRFMTYWKAAGLAGLAGVLIAAGIAFAIHDRYICSASLTYDANTAALPQSELTVLSRDNLVKLITIPALDLYRDERRRLPIEDVAVQMQRHIRLQSFQTTQSPQGKALRISFEYPDRIKAQKVVSYLVEELQEHARPMKMAILEQPIVPNTPAYPNRAMMLFLGAMGGILTGLLALAIFRRTTQFAVVRVGFPKDTKQFIDSQVASGPYRDANEYIRELIRADRERKATK